MITSQEALVAGVIAVETRTGTRASRWTLEAVAYVGLGALALLWRLGSLGSSFLGPEEARQAVAAFHLQQGTAQPIGWAAGGISPGLLSLQALAFSLFAANDAWARLPVVLITCLYPLAIWQLRPFLGRQVALLAAALLCLSPLWTALGWQGLAPEAAVVALMLAFGLALQGWLSGRLWLGAAAAACLGVALALAAEAWVGGLLLVLAGIWLLPAQERASLAGYGRRAARLALPALVLAFALAATAGGAYPGGLQDALNLPANWVSGFYYREAGAVTAQALTLLTFEPLLIGLSVAAFIFAPPRSRWHDGLCLFAATAVILALASGHRLAGLALCLPALALLGAEAGVALLHRLGTMDSHLRLQGGVVAAVLIGYGYISLSGVARRGDLVYLVLAFTAVGIGLALLGLVAVREGWAQAATLVGLAGLLVLVPWSLSYTAANWQPAMAGQRLAFADVSQAGLGDLRFDLERLAWSRASDRYDLGLMVEEGAGPLVAWYVRGMQKVTFVEHIPVDVADDAGVQALVTAGDKPLPLAGGGDQFVGQSYTISRTWVPRLASLREWLTWALFRAPAATGEDRVTLWVRK